MHKKILVTGATGLAGAEVVRQAILDGSIAEITAIVRRPLAMTHPKLKTVLHSDYTDYQALIRLFADHDALIWCLGISQTQVDKDEYIRITYDYVLACAQAVAEANPALTFIFLSGMGADSKEKSRTLFARIKGKAENALMALPLPSLFIARPGGIRPIHKKENAAFFEKILIPTYPFFEFLLPFMMISSVDLAKAMLHMVKHGAPKRIMENMDLKRSLKVPAG